MLKKEQGTGFERHDGEFWRTIYIYSRSKIDPEYI